MIRSCLSPNKSLENRRENTDAFPASQLQRYALIIKLIPPQKIKIGLIKH